MLFVYFALPQTGIRLDKFESFVVSLAIYAGAYLTEVFRAGLRGVPSGVIEAGRAIGLTGLQLALHVISPIMLRNACRARHHLHLAVQGYLACRRDRRARTHLQARKINIETFRVVEVWARPACSISPPAC